MTLHVNTLTIGCRDAGSLAAFWSAALDWVVVSRRREDVLVAPGTTPEDHPGAIPLLFLENGGRTAATNRFHLDLVPDDQAAEVARLESLGARRVDIGQGEVAWVVMVDPEGNEFCVLRSYDG
jgi:hypothetical protein